MTNVDTYKAAIIEQAANASEPDALFVRLSDDECEVLARDIIADSSFRSAVLHDNCKGVVDTFLLSVAQDLMSA